MLEIVGRRAYVPAAMSKPLLSNQNRTKILAVLSERHGSWLRNERFTISARRAGETVVAEVELASLDRTFVYQLAAALPRDKYAGLEEDEALDLCLDFVDWYLGEFFASQREVLLPLDYQPHRFGDVEVLAKGELRNEFLDDAADAWLRGERPDVDGEWRRIKQSGG